jgi:hypothetical protein
MLHYPSFFFTKANPRIGDKIVSKEEFRNTAKIALRGRPPGTATKKSTTGRSRAITLR